MVGVLAAIIGGGTAMQMGAATGSLATVESLMMWFCSIFGILTGGGLIADHVNNKTLKSKMLARNNKLSLLAKRHNDVIDLLEDQYHMEKESMGFFGSHQKEQLRQRYEQLYIQNQQDFEQERRQLLAQQQQVDDPVTRMFKKYWKTLFAAGFLCLVAAFSYTIGTIDRLEPQPQAEQLGEWTAENIPMPHLTNGHRYVSNPDQVVSESTVQLLDRQLKKMDDSLNIESAMIIVNHVANADVFRFAQDVFDRYGVGKEDRGLVIVLAYADHKVRTHTGRALEADLTDIECSRLQQTYALPYMKAEQPDSGMLYFTDALYKTLQGKELPQAVVYEKTSDADTAREYLALYFFILMGMFFLMAYIIHRYNGNSGRNLLHANPFAKAAPVIIVGDGGFGGGRGGGFGGGGFGGGGGFSGGSSGGGGATSSW